MDRSLNPRLIRLDVLVGAWELTASSGERIMSTSRSTFQWLGDSGFLVQRTEPPIHLAPEWESGAPQWVEAVIGLGGPGELVHRLRGGLPAADCLTNLRKGAAFQQIRCPQ